MTHSQSSSRGVATYDWRGVDDPSSNPQFVSPWELPPEYRSAVGDEARHRNADAVAHSCQVKSPMPTNADLIRASYDAFHRGDLEAALALFHPEILWTHPDGMSDYGLGGTRRGHAEVRAFMKHARTLFQEIRPMPREFLESGHRVVVFGAHSMRSARTGRACTVDFVHSWVLENGKATHFTDFHDTAPVRRLLEPEPGPRPF
jgi:uncharacterized protein